MSIRDQFDQRHGGPFDRGSADAYYWRCASPHYFLAGTYMSPKVTELTKEEVAAYMAGYNSQEDRKDWGHREPIRREEPDPEGEDESDE